MKPTAAAASAMKVIALGVNVVVLILGSPPNGGETNIDDGMNDGDNVGESVGDNVEGAAVGGGVITLSIVVNALEHKVNNLTL